MQTKWTPPTESLFGPTSALALANGAPSNDNFPGCADFNRQASSETHKRVPDLPLPHVPQEGPLQSLLLSHPSELHSSMTKTNFHGKFMESHDDRLPKALMGGNVAVSTVLPTKLNKNDVFLSEDASVGANPDRIGAFRTKTKPGPFIDDKHPTKVAEGNRQPAGLRPVSSSTSPSPSLAVAAEDKLTSSSTSRGNRGKGAGTTEAFPKRLHKWAKPKTGATQHRSSKVGKAQERSMPSVEWLFQDDDEAEGANRQMIVTNVFEEESSALGDEHQGGQLRGKYSVDSDDKSDEGSSSDSPDAWSEEARPKKRRMHSSKVSSEDDEEKDGPVIRPLQMDSSVTMSCVGGLDQQRESLREMIQMPLENPEIFQRFDVQPPGGVLLTGPPGTGKTLIVRAMAGSCKAVLFVVNATDCQS